MEFYHHCIGPTQHLKTVAIHTAGSSILLRQFLARRKGAKQSDSAGNPKLRPVFICTVIAAACCLPMDTAWFGQESKHDNSWCMFFEHMQHFARWVMLASFHQVGNCVRYLALLQASPKLLSGAASVPTKTLLIHLVDYHLPRVSAHTALPLAGVGAEAPVRYCAW
jgi:hypothetical protein